MKSTYFIIFLFVSIISFSCSKQSNVYQIEETKSWSLEINNDLQVDSSMIRLIKPYSDSLNNTLGRVISYSDQKMSKGFPEGLLGNFLSDLILDYSRNTLNLKIDFCLQNNGGFRADLPAGNVTLQNIYEIMPFDNKLVVLQLDITSMEALLNYVSTGEAVSVSGIRIVIHKNTKNEAFINNTPLDPARTYLMATSDYLANGGSSMHFLKNCKRINITDFKIRDIEIAALEQKHIANQHLNSKLDGRIQVVE